MMQQTSLYAYAQLIWEPLELADRQKKVYAVIRNYDAITDRQISMILNWPINTVTPRRGELVKLGVIQKCGCTLNEKTHRPELLWGVLR